MMSGKDPVERPLAPPALEQLVSGPPRRRLQAAGDRRGRPQDGVRDAQAGADLRDIFRFAATGRPQAVINGGGFDRFCAGIGGEQQ
jgi:hypothetical protein